MADTLAYHSTEFITTVKSFTVEVQSIADIFLKLHSHRNVIIPVIDCKNVGFQRERERETHRERERMCVCVREKYEREMREREMIEKK